MPNVVLNMTKSLLFLTAWGISLSSNANVSVFGSLELEERYTDQKVDTFPDDAYVGIEFEAEGRYSTFYGKSSISFDKENNQIESSVRDSYIGIVSENLDFSFGQMKNIQHTVSRKTIDPFKSAKRTSKLSNRGRHSNTVMLKYDIGSLGLMTSNYSERYEFGVSLYSSYVVYSKDKNTKDELVTFATKTKKGNYTVGLAYENINNFEDERYYVTGSYRINDTETHIGWKNGSDVNRSTTYEIVHNFEKDLYAYISLIDETSKSELYTIGVGFRF